METVLSYKFKAPKKLPMMGCMCFAVTPNEQNVKAYKSIIENNGSVPKSIVAFDEGLEIF